VTRYLLERLLVLIPVLLSLGVHEWAHAWTATMLGDDTAEKSGRLTLNPLAHIDPLGTLLLPLIGIPFGWARPVPVEPTRFRPGVRMGVGLLLTAVAGPLSNLLLALVATSLVALTSRGPWQLHYPGVELLLRQGVIVNLSLAVFNILPIPPLDGSRVVEGLIPFEWRRYWDPVTRLGGWLLLGVLLLPMLTGIHLFGWVGSAAMRLLAWASG
jgi:Zn-dependent protease